MPADVWVSAGRRAAALLAEVPGITGIATSCLGLGLGLVLGRSRCLGGIRSPSVVVTEAVVDTTSIRVCQHFGALIGTLDLDPLVVLDQGMWLVLASLVFTY